MALPRPEDHGQELTSGWVRPECFWRPVAGESIAGRLAAIQARSQGDGEYMVFAPALVEEGATTIYRVDAVGVSRTKALRDTIPAELVGQFLAITYLGSDQMGNGRTINRYTVTRVSADYCRKAAEHAVAGIPKASERKPPKAVKGAGPGLERGPDDFVYDDNDVPF